MLQLNAGRDKVASLCDAAQISKFNAEQAVLFGHPSPIPSLSIDGQNGNTYCDSTSGRMIDPNGDDTGWVADTADHLKCADAVGKMQSRLVAAAIKCHIKLNDSFFKGKAFDEEACEETNPSQKGALDKFNQQRDKLGQLAICPPCLDSTHIDALGASVLSQVDSANALAYPCQLP